MNNQSDALSQRLQIITENASIHLGLVEEHQASTAPTDAIQLELNFNQATTDYH